MEIICTEMLRIADASSVGEARRAALQIAHRLDFDEDQAGKMALLATEAGRNALVHAGGGSMVISGIRRASESSARILAMDNGPGIPDVSQAMSDGYSTAGTPGGGMGAMKRIASRLEIFTGKSGTIVLMEFGGADADEDLRIAGTAVPYPGEQHCGDAWSYHVEPGRALAILVDGLGHGFGAAEAAREAVHTFHANAKLAPAELIGCIHDALKKTRGAVAAVAEIRPAERSLSFAGVGNIAAVYMRGLESRSLVSHNGTLGATAARIQEFRSAWNPGSMMVMHTDGVQTRWDLNAYTGLTARHPAIVGGALLRDFRRHRDDAGVVVIKAS